MTVGLGPRGSFSVTYLLVVGVLIGYTSLVLAQYERDLDHDDSDIINCDDGLVIPCWQPLKNIPFGLKFLRGSIYFIILLYLFIGVSIISDRFMAAIEVITSQVKELTVHKKGGERQIIVVNVWNETVANLTLMALGSSAPEILLAVIEILTKNFEAGELGPGTIVGSAAYNLFVIIAICVSVIPNGEVRKIKHLRVFFVTATWSVFAYVWLYMILSVFSPGVVEVWEGLVTFSFFPATVLTAYVADRILLEKCLRKVYRLNNRGVIVQTPDLDPNDVHNNRYAMSEDGGREDATQNYITILRELRNQYPTADLESLERKALELLLNKVPKSRAFYRIQATRRMTGGGDILQRISGRAKSSLSGAKAEIRRESTAATFDPVIANSVFFEPNHYTVLESCGRFEVRVIRTGNLDKPCTVNYYTEDGSACAGSDYVAIRGSLHFNPGESEKFITLEIIDDDIFEQEEHFFVRLSETVDAARTLVVSHTPATIFILDDDDGGVFQFPGQNYEVVESVGIFELKVERCSGARGNVAVSYWTEDGTAKAGKEYEENQGELIFKNNESE